jgi:hypothetical protein
MGIQANDLMCAMTTVSSVTVMPPTVVQGMTCVDALALHTIKLVVVALPCKISTGAHAMDVKYAGIAIIAVLGGVVYSTSSAVERALMQAFSQSTAAQRLAVLYTQGTILGVVSSS